MTKQIAASKLFVLYFQEILAPLTVCAEGRTSKLRSTFSQDNANRYKVRIHNQEFECGANEPFVFYLITRTTNSYESLFYTASHSFAKTSLRNWLSYHFIPVNALLSPHDLLETLVRVPYECLHSYGVHTSAGRGS